MRERRAATRMHPHIALAASLTAGLILSCRTLPIPVKTATPTHGSPPATIGLPPQWTPTNTSTAAPTRTPTETPLPSLTPTTRPSRTPSPTRPTATPYPAPDLSDPYAVVEAAFAAHLRQDEATLEALYDDIGEQICKLGFGSMTTCISLPYRVQGLVKLDRWWVEEHQAGDTPPLGLIVLSTRWEGSEKEWQQLFTVYDYDGEWLIHEHSTQVYPAAP